MKIDNFALSTHQRCPAEYELRIREHWTSRKRSPALRFGGALHVGLANWYRSHDPELALEGIVSSWDSTWDSDDYRTLEKCARTMIEYIQRYPQETFTVVGAPTTPIVEQTFTLETGWYCGCLSCGHLNDDPEFGYCTSCKTSLEPIEYGGILDTLIEFSGTMYVLEHKTTSVMGASYFDQFKPDNQVTGYIWAGSKMSGGQVAGAMVNAVAISKTGATRFDRRITSRNALDIHEWLTSLRMHCTEILRHQKLGIFPLRTTSCMTKYGRCQFHDVHTLSDPGDRFRRLEQDYIKQPWDYEHRDEPTGVESDA